MKNITMVLLILLVLGIVVVKSGAVDVIYPGNGFNTEHSSLTNLDYANSGHRGFAKIDGDNSKSFTCKDIHIYGNVISNNPITYIHPNNSSFTLSGLSEKNYSSIENKPTSFASFGLVIASLTLYNEHLSTTTPHMISGMVAVASIDEHIETNAAHGGTIVDETYFYGDIVEKPWHRSGVKWASYPASGTTDRYGLTALNYKNKMWVIGGLDTTYRNDVQYTEDGLFWMIATTSANFSPRRNHSSFVYDNKMWVIGGYDGSPMRDSWYSTDGINWTCATTSVNFTARHSMSSCIHDNKMWILGGFDPAGKTDLWYSTDGANWTIASTSLFSIRLGVNLVSYNSKMWAFGGYDGTFLTECYESTNGLSWNLATTTLNLGGVAFVNPTIYSGKCWAVCGWRSPQTNESWYSTDMINWTCATTTTNIQYKRYHGTVAFNGRLFLIGGDGAITSQTCDFNYD